MASVYELNEQAARCLKAVRESLGIRSGAKFARELADVAGGSPDPTTYNRWERGDQLIPAWALLALSQLAGRPLDELLTTHADDSAGLRAELTAVTQALIRLQRTVASDGELLDRVAQHVGLDARRRLDDQEAGNHDELTVPATLRESP